MNQEVAVRWSPGRLPRRGVVVDRPSTRVITVEWEDGDWESVKSTDASVRYGIAGTRRLEWLLEPGLVEDEFQSDPIAVLEAIVRDSGSITEGKIKKQLAGLGVDQQDVEDGMAKCKDALKSHQHILVKGATHTWSNDPIVRAGPLDFIKSLTPHEALDRLETNTKFKHGEKAALFEAVRLALTKP